MRRSLQRDCWGLGVEETPDEHSVLETNSVIEREWLIVSKAVKRSSHMRMENWLLDWEMWRIWWSLAEQHTADSTSLDCEEGSAIKHWAWCKHLIVLTVNPAAQVQLLLPLVTDSCGEAHVVFASTTCCYLRGTVSLVNRRTEASPKLSQGLNAPHLSSQPKFIRRPLLSYRSASPGR